MINKNLLEKQREREFYHRDHRDKAEVYFKWVMEEFYATFDDKNHTPVSRIRKLYRIINALEKDVQLLAHYNVYKEIRERVHHYLETMEHCLDEYLETLIEGVNI